MIDIDEQHLNDGMANIAARLYEATEQLATLTAENAALNERVETVNREFKNFHRLICEASNYHHDETDWRRDQASCCEHVNTQIKAQLAAAEPKVTNEMKARFIGEFSWKEESPYYDENGDYHDHEAKRTVPWDLCKRIYKEMAGFARTAPPQHAAMVPDDTCAICGSVGEGACPRNGEIGDCIYRPIAAPTPPATAKAADAAEDCVNSPSGYHVFDCIESDCYCMWCGIEEPSGYIRHRATPPAQEGGDANVIG